MPMVIKVQTEGDFKFLKRYSTSLQGRLLSPEFPPLLPQTKMKVYLSCILVGANCRPSNQGRNLVFESVGRGQVSMTILDEVLKRLNSAL